MSDLTDFECKTVHIFAYSSMHEQSTKGQEQGWKWRANWVFFSRLLHPHMGMWGLRVSHVRLVSNLKQILRKKPDCLEVRVDRIMHIHLFHPQFMYMIYFKFEFTIQYPKINKFTQSCLHKSIWYIICQSQCCQLSWIIRETPGFGS